MDRAKAPQGISRASASNLQAISCFFPPLMALTVASVSADVIEDSGTKGGLVNDAFRAFDTTGGRR